MARKTVVVSDLSGEQIPEGKGAQSRPSSWASFLGAWYAQFLTRAKLVTDGGGGGGGSGPGTYGITYASIKNQPGLIGIHLRRTMVFGKHLHGNIEKGLTIDRRQAAECIARLYDKSTGQFVTNLCGVQRIPANLGNS
jgi:hypothetical protein